MFLFFYNSVGQLPYYFQDFEMSPSYKRRTQIMKNLINAVAFNRINTVIPCAKRAKEKSSSARPMLMQILVIYVLQHWRLCPFFMRYLCIAFLHLRSISIDKQVVPCTFPGVAFIIIQPCSCLIRFEILKR